MAAKATDPRPRPGAGRAGGCSARYVRGGPGAAAAGRRPDRHAQCRDDDGRPGGPRSWGRRSRRRAGDSRWRRRGLGAGAPGPRVRRAPASSWPIACSCTPPPWLAGGPGGRKPGGDGAPAGPADPRSAGSAAGFFSVHGYQSPKPGQASEQLLRARPDLVLVALGVPRQETWIQRLPSPAAVLWMGVGGSFDVWAGLKTRAPAWMGALHIEWLYRLIKEPTRWRRMLALPAFAWAVLRG